MSESWTQTAWEDPNPINCGLIHFILPLNRNLFFLVSLKNYHALQLGEIINVKEEAQN
jgi:hypothetical protein